ncbi:hypothetical protein OIB37_28275 [Streptomyces sp. NBC_00820]|uniref:hypothetical protein n=1 Tax=Streptomyces sp. NBC_00820 TaxID=2975842 RepID=UPI002ED4621E|nr:hypothetical protein OIB37_28275 [Streptomyces sp. NBC_00820]
MEPRGYRMVISTEQDYVAACAVVEQQLVAWLRSKRYDTSAFEEGRTEIAPGVTLDRDFASGQRGAYSRWRMRETGDPAGPWQSTLVVRSEPQPDQGLTWVQVEVEHLPTGVGALPKWTKKPNIVQLLLDSLEARDGLAEVRAKPFFIEAADVNEVLEELCDPQRRMPVVVATVPYGTDADAWAESTVEPLFQYLTGLAILYVLAPEAQAAFNAAMEFHPVFGGGVRTYLPGLDPAWKADGQRHPVMSRRTIENDRQHAARILATLPQRLALRQPLPAALNRLPLQRSRPLPSSGAGRLREENVTLRTLLDEAEQAESRRVQEVNDLYAELDKAEHGGDELRGENQELYEKAQESQRLIRFLREELKAAGAHAAAHLTEPVQKIVYPDSFADLLECLGELPHLEFTGNRKITAGLDSQSVDNWLHVAWDGLLALNHFAQASAEGTAASDFRAWCNSEASSANPFPAAKVAMRESDTVARNAKLRQERMLPVPKSVDPTGRAFMQAHLKIGGGNTVAPRLHFHEDGPRSAKVYVGYLGPHLRNTLT